jgi:hypothetical protein
MLDPVYDRRRGSIGASHPLDVLIPQALEPLKSVLANDEREEVQHTIIVVGVNECHFALPIRVQNIEVRLGDALSWDLRGVVVEWAKLVCECKQRTFNFV